MKWRPYMVEYKQNQKWQPNKTHSARREFFCCCCLLFVTYIRSSLMHSQQNHWDRLKYASHLLPIQRISNGLVSQSEHIKAVFTIWTETICCHYQYLELLLLDFITSNRFFFCFVSLYAYLCSLHQTYKKNI